MATGTSNVIREYLVSLGYKVEEAQQRRFDLSLLKTDANAGRLALTLVGVATAAQAMAVVWARSMERMYYSGQKAESSVGALKALEFAARNVGVSGESMTATIEGFARSIRANPGLVGLLQIYGVPTKGRTPAEQFIDLMDRLQSFPVAIAQQVAGLFGIDPDTYYLISKNLDKYKEAADLQKQVYREFGVDADRAAESAKQYANRLREVEERLAALKDRAMIEFLPAFESMTRAVNESLKALGRWSTGPGKKLADTVRQATPSGTPGAAAVEAYSKVSDYLMFRLRGGGPEGPSTPGQRRSFGTVDHPNARPAGDPSAWFAALEQKYGIPAGVLAKIYKRESNEGRNLVSPKGALGPFQFMPDTAREWDVDPWDFFSSSMGAARMLQWALKRYGGDLQKAAAAYNWGAGNLDRYGLGAAPAETRGYVEAVSGQPIKIEQKTDIHVNGAGSPADTARAVAREQVGVHNEVVRNLQGVMR